MGSSGEVVCLALEANAKGETEVKNLALDVCAV